MKALSFFPTTPTLTLALTLTLLFLINVSQVESFFQNPTQQLNQSPSLQHKEKRLSTSLSTVRARNQKEQIFKFQLSPLSALSSPEEDSDLKSSTLQKQQQMVKKLMIPFGVGLFAAFSNVLPLPLPSSLTPQVVNAAETISKQVSKFKVKETVNGVKFFEVQKGSGESPHDGDLIIINYIGYLSDGTVFDSQHAPGKKPLAFQFGKNQVIPGLEDALKTMQPGGERQVLVPPSMGYGERGVCLDKDDVNKEKCLIPPGSNLKYQLQLKRVAVSPI